jgi:Fe-S cluster assembly protein SufD
MNTLSKTDLTEEIISSFNRVSFSESLSIREEALHHFTTLRLPTRKTEDYRFTPITKHLAQNFIWSNKNTLSSLSSINEFKIPGLGAYTLVFINGIFSKERSHLPNSGGRLIVKTLSDAFQFYPNEIESYFNKISNSSTDAFAALNTAFWQEGAFIKIEDEVTVDRPIQIIHVNDANHAQVISHTKLLLILGKASKATLVETFETIGTSASFHTFTEEIFLHDNATLEYFKIQNDKGAACQVATTCIAQLDESKVSAFTLTLNGQLIRNNFSILVDGERCESHFNGLYLLKGKTLVDNHTVVDHKKPNSQSNELYKGIMDDHSKGIFNGKIYVRPKAQKTNAFQSNRNILVSDHATINTKPQLEIWADDVKCSHGCTTGQLDEEALFYLQSRGISKQSAQAMLLYAFASDVFATIENNSLKAHFDLLISERLQKDF